jgi:hypothetical protein
VHPIRRTGRELDPDRVPDCYNRSVLLRPSTLLHSPAPDSRARSWRSLPVLGLSFAARRHWSLLLFATVALSLALSVGVALTMRPWCDEAWFASPAYNLLRHGFMGTTILDPHGFVFAPVVEGLDKFTYWIMPGYIFFQVACYKIAGFSLFSMRAISLGWAAVALGAWFIIVDRLTENRNLALLAVFLLATEEHFVLSAATARMDMMCAALSLASGAAYLYLHANMTRAVLAASSLAALAIFTHPNGIIGLGTVAFFALLFDRHRLSGKLVLRGAAPTVILASLWGLYILRDPHSFVSQMQGQAQLPHRLGLSVDLVKDLLQEVNRYVATYGLDSGSPLFLLRIVFYSYVVSFFAILFAARLRQLPGAVPLLGLAAGVNIFLTGQQKGWYYLVFILPPLTALLALFMNWLWRRSLPAKWIVCLYLFVVVGLNLGVLGARVYHDTYRNRFLPAVDYLRRNVSPGDLIVASGEMAFSLGFDGQVVDNARLGTTSPRAPDYIVMETFYSEFWQPWLKENEPTTYEEMTELLWNSYDLKYDQTHDPYRTWGIYDEPYKIFKRRKPEEH